MYTPNYANIDNALLVKKILEENSFATIITNQDGKIEATHLPFLIKDNGKKLVSHLARANPLWKNFSNEVVVIFQGPHTYITPAWYKNPLNVPTWSYVSIHCYGTVKLIEDQPGIEKILTETVNFFENAYDSNWKYELPEKFNNVLVKAIVGFEIDVHRMESKFKLSQNRDPQDYEGVLQGLAKRPDEMSQRVLQIMKESK